MKYPDASRWQIVDAHGRTQTIHRSGGRVTQVDLTAFDGTTASYVFTYTYDAMGRKATVSSWGDAALVMTYGPYDRFGRASQVQPPGSNPATRITYQGDRVVTREVKIATGAAGERTSVFTTEIYDAFGRLERICEAQESAWAGTCTGIETRYTYDESGNLTHVCSGTSDTGCGQERFFTYDNRGLLTGERHPEIGPTGNGWTYYTYDALGNALSRILAGTSDFSLLYTYDRASRLIRIDEVTGPGESRPLKEFYFARTNDGTDLRRGKLVRAKRHNWVDVVAPLRVSGTLDAVITDSYRYEGLGGRPSLRQTSYQLNTTTFAFQTRYEYDQQGNPSKVIYPRCLHARCVGEDPHREVEYQYTRGFLTAVPGFANSLVYQAGGMLHRIVHSNGVIWEQTVNPADRMRRPYEIKTTGVVTGNWSTGTYAYDGGGNIQRIDGQRFQYDGLSRMVMGQVAVDGQLRTQTVSYDDYGNITQLITHGTTQLTPVNNSTNRMTGASYDAAGNMTDIILGGETFKYTYDALSMMKYLQSNQGRARVSLYDADDRRIVAFECPLDSCGLNTAEEIWTLRGLDGNVVRTYSHPGGGDWDWQTDHVFRNDKLLTAVEAAGSAGPGTYHFHLDHLGTPRQISSEYATQAAMHSYYPFGAEATGSDQDDIPMKFTGHERDRNGSNAKGDLDYMRARYCSPEIGRFLSPDPLFRSARTSVTPQWWNRYTYVGGDPINFTDPEGLTIFTSVRNLKYIRNILREVGATDEAEALDTDVIEEEVTILLFFKRTIKKTIVTTKGGVRLSESTNPVAQLIGKAIETNTEIYFNFTNKDLGDHRGARTRSREFEEYNRLYIDINITQLAAARVPGFFPNYDGIPVPLSAAIVHELGHVYGFFALKEKYSHRLFGNAGPTDGIAVEKENEYRRIVGLPLRSVHD